MNRIYFFTGTGNSLHIAKKIAKELKDCELVAIQKDMSMKVPQGYERIGVVYPTYGWASPLMVADFFRKAQFGEQKKTYLFAVATCGGLALNAIPQLGAILRKRGLRLHYGASVRMFKNSITNYGMGKKANKAAVASDKRALRVIHDIVEKRTVKISSVNQFIYKLHLKYAKGIHEKAQDFNVNENCVSCGICKSVCPAKNISMSGGKPAFEHHCELCGACIQHCPKQAINYKDKTQTRGRYVHPNISTKEIADYYKA